MRARAHVGRKGSGSRIAKTQGVQPPFCALPAPHFPSADLFPLFRLFLIFVTFWGPLKINILLQESFRLQKTWEDSIENSHLLLTQILTYM